MVILELTKEQRTETIQKMIQYAILIKIDEKMEFTQKFLNLKKSYRQNESTTLEIREFESTCYAIQELSGEDKETVDEIEFMCNIISLISKKSQTKS